METVLTTVPRYDSSKRGRRVIVGSLKDLIDDSLGGNERKRAMGLKKQCMRDKDIYELLLEKGFQISYPCVCKYIASFAKHKEEAKSKGAFVRGYYPPGESCEFTGEKLNLILMESFNVYISLYLP